MAKIIILSLPRSGSSILAQLIASSGYKNFVSKNSSLISASEFNKGGYFEDILITLLNDQLIRLVYGYDYSFLYSPTLSQFKNIQFPLTSDFSYNLEDIFLPEDYSQKIKEYSGCDWDVWGLTRMVEGQKWHNCYSKHGVSNYQEIKNTLNNLVNQFNNSDEDILIKDPRLALVAPLYNLKDFKVIYIKRNAEDTLNSMRKHYGVNLFTSNYLPYSNYCSNHFNYKVKYQDFNYYFKTYNNIIEEFIKDKDSLTLNYENLNSLDTLNNLNNFIGGEVDINLYTK